MYHDARQLAMRRAAPQRPAQTVGTICHGAASCRAQRPPLLTP